MHDLIPMPASGSLTAIDAEAILEPGRGKTKTGRFWRHAIDDRPWTESAIRGRPISTPGTAGVSTPSEAMPWANRLPALRGSFLNNSGAFAGGTRTTVLLQ